MADGSCITLAQETAMACGLGGESCVACPSGSTCESGQCSSGSCNQVTCSGCCTSNGACLLGSQQSAAACGEGGQACQSCGAGTCVTGVCRTSSACTPATCPDGCCTLRGTCLGEAQQSSAACGQGGKACEFCRSMPCVKGVCQSSTPCNSSTCSDGCCTPEGLCLLAGQQSPASCGQDGRACQSCGSQQCINGACQSSPTCNNSTCPQGCCGAQGCVPYAQQNALLCGQSGAACRPCVSGASCNSGVCKTVAKAWKVKVISAIVQDDPQMPWDPSGSSLSGPLPDPFVEVILNANGHSGTTKWIDDQLRPIFNEVVLPNETLQSLAAGLTCIVGEDDGPFVKPEFMGQCTLSSVSPVVGAQVTLSNCTDFVTQVILEFTH